MPLSMVLDMVRLLIDEAGVSVHTRAPGTPLVFAAKYGHPDVAHFLVERGASLVEVSDHGFCFLDYASPKLADLMLDAVTADPTMWDRVRATLPAGFAKQTDRRLQYCSRQLWSAAPISGAARPRRRANLLMRTLSAWCCKTARSATRRCWAPSVLVAPCAGDGSRTRRHHRAVPCFKVCARRHD
jgi:hypothetical protein